ncbi:hypothetical protein CBL_02916 [Carabus blaptoides fortunei]
MDLLKRERELLDRERTWMENSRGNMSTTLRAPCELTGKLLPEFDPARMTGLSATQWIQRVDGVGTAYSWDDSLKLVHPVNKLRGAAKLGMNSLVSEVTTWNSFRQVLLHSFASVSDQAEIHLQLTKRTRERDESSEAYIYSMRAIAKRGQVENSSLMKYILNGLGDRELIRSLSLCEFVDIEDLLLKIKRYESVQDRARFGTQMRSNDYPAENSRRERPGGDCRTGEHPVPEGRRLQGFGNGICETLGKQAVLLKIGEVKLEAEILILPNEAQTDAVLIGQSALDRPDNRIGKEKGL